MDPTQIALISLLIAAISVIAGAKPGKKTSISLCTILALIGIYACNPENMNNIALKIKNFILPVKADILTISFCTAAAIVLLIIFIVKRKKTIRSKTDDYALKIHVLETSQKPVHTPLSLKNRKSQPIDPTVKKYLPYSVNRSCQIEKMEISLLESRSANQLIWLIHGNEDQCNEELLNCVQLFYWKDLYGGKSLTLPKIISIDCPEKTNENKFEPLMKNRIKNKLRVNQSTENMNESDLMQLLDHDYNGPIILCTTLKTPELRHWKTSIISHLETFRKNLGQRESGLPLIFCMIVIYNEYKRTRRKDKKFNQKIKQHIENFSPITLPELSDIHERDIEKWKNKDFVREYLSTDDFSGLHDLYKKSSYRNGIPMRVLADEIKNRYFS